MNTNYPITNTDLRADWEHTHYQSFAGVPHTANIEQADRLYIPAHTEVTVVFGGKIPDLRFKTGDVPAWSDIVVAAIRRSASYKERMSKRTNKAEPCILYEGRALKKTEQPKLQGIYPKFPQPRPEMGMA